VAEEEPASDRQEDLHRGTVHERGGAEDHEHRIEDVGGIGAEDQEHGPRCAVAQPASDGQGVQGPGGGGQGEPQQRRLGQVAQHELERLTLKQTCTIAHTA
jgi:hypothetical protein